MKKFYLSSLSVFTLAAWFVFGFHASAQVGTDAGTDVPTVSPNLVISQFQAGGIASASDEFVELHNNGTTPVDLNGYRVVYRSASGTNDVGPFAVWSAPTILQPGQYYLIAATEYTGSRVPDITYSPSVCLCSMAAAAGGLAIRNGDQNSGTIVDAVGWGSATNVFFEGTRTAAPGNSNSQARKLNGCQDTDNNLNDFINLAPSVPRNGTSPLFDCSSAGGIIQASGLASPNQVAPGNLTFLTVTVVPATTPPSTAIIVNVDLTSIGGSANQPLFDDGTNGDATAGDNVFSYFAVIPADSSAGIRSLTVNASDAQSHTASTTINLTVTAPADPAEHIALGNPTGATTDINNPLNYLLVKTQFVESYNRDKGTPNWVAWHLDASWITGAANRQNDFRPDTSLPAGWYQVLDTDYSGSGFDRGHNCPSGDRTDSVADNSATFFMTNMMPQSPFNNQGVWADLEVYCRTLVGQGNELYIYAGGTGQGGTGSNGGITNTIANGHVVVPAKTWKVIVVLPVGSNDVDRVAKTTRTIAVIMPNDQSVGSPGAGNWRNYRTSVRQVEQLTGYTFFTNVRPMVRRLIKQRVDTQ